MKASRKAVDLRSQITIAPSCLLVTNDERYPLAVPSHSFVKCCPNGRFDQRLGPIASKVARA